MANDNKLIVVAGFSALLGGGGTHVVKEGLDNPEVIHYGARNCAPFVVAAVEIEQIKCSIKLLKND